LAMSTSLATAAQDLDSFAAKSRFSTFPGLLMQD
jgi:hypothetical protein